ncbi:MAG: hypothetical protein M1823_002778 [Watsoniomyces obsoletus]|nr:MAG: hypothetical protein M1823_002778 [Watsoniomyces obsoletus]
MDLDDILRRLPPPPPPGYFIPRIGWIRYLAFKDIAPNHPLLVPPLGAPNGTVSIEACRILAGAGRGSHNPGMAFTHITTWVIPSLLLVGNINYAPFRKPFGLNEVMVAFHLFGNPVDSIESLLARLDAERRIQARCQAEMGKEDGPMYATILRALDDMGFAEKFESRFNQLAKIARSGNPKDIRAVRTAATDLSINRVYNTRRVILAVTAYMAAVTTNYTRAALNLPTQNPPENTISHIMSFRCLFFWLLPTVLLSAHIGIFPSERTAQRILRNLESQIDGHPLHLHIRRPEPWNGANYTWRPHKDHQSVLISRVPDRRRWVLFCLSFMTVTAAWGLAFTISYLTPTRGFQSRNLTQTAYWTAWIIDAVMTRLIIWSYRRWTRKRHQRGMNTKKLWFWIVWVIDMPIAIGILTTQLAAFGGWWHSCFTWSGVFSRGWKRAYVNLNLQQEVAYLMRRLFPQILFPALVGHILLAPVLIYVARGGIKRDEMREEGKMEETDEEEGKGWRGIWGRLRKRDSGCEEQKNVRGSRHA